MSDFYLDMQSIANGILSDFNQGVIDYVIETPGNGPADNPGAPSILTTPLIAATARGVEFKFVMGDVLASDLQITFPGGIVEPQPEGFFTVDSVRYKIVQIKRVPAAGTPVVFIVIVRK